MKVKHMNKIPTQHITPLIVALTAAVFTLTVPSLANAQDTKGRLETFWETANHSDYDGAPAKHHLSNITPSLEAKYAEIARGNVPTLAKFMEMSEAEQKEYTKAMATWLSIAVRIKGKGSSRFGKEQKEVTYTPTYHDFLARYNATHPKLQPIFDEAGKEINAKREASYAGVKTNATGRLTTYWNAVDRDQLDSVLKQILSRATQGEEEAFEQLVNERIPSAAEYAKMDATTQRDYFRVQNHFLLLHGHMVGQNKKRGAATFGAAERELTGCYDLRKYAEKCDRIRAKTQHIRDAGKKLNAMQKSGN